MNQNEKANISKKPNIVFFLNDHQAYYKHGMEQGPHIRRPNFEHIARDGALFTNAYAACPLCGPVRRTILTGLFPHAHGEVYNDMNIPFSDRETYLDILSDDGYSNYYFGKWHAGPGTAHDHSCEGFSYPSYSNPYIKEEYQTYLKEQNLPRPQIKIEHTVDSFRPFIKDGMLYEQKLDWNSEHCSGILLTPKETHEAFFLAHLACRQIEQLAKNKSVEPFSLRVDFWGPHQPYFVTQEYADMYQPEQIPEYPSFSEDVYSSKPEIYQFEMNAGISEDKRIIHPNPLPWSVWQEIISRCYAQITMIDEAMGLIIDALERGGLSDNTIIVCSADHGDALGCHGGHFDKGCYMAEETLRIPLAIRYPNKVPENTIVKRPVSSADIPVTILEAAGLAFDTKVHGKSLISNLEETRGYAVSQTFGHRGIGSVHFARAIFDGRYKYVYNCNQTDEFYDIAVDPYELTNQIANPNYKSFIQKLQSAFLEWAKANDDTEGYKKVVSK